MKKTKRQQLNCSTPSPKKLGGTNTNLLFRKFTMVRKYYYESFHPAQMIGMALHFFPKDHIIATVFFLNQNPKDRKWQTLQDYSFCKDRFSRELIDHAKH